MTDTPLQRFLSSMVMDVDKWRDGIGYDMKAIDAASPDERAEIEKVLLARGASDWRDIEALARLKSPKAKDAIAAAAKKDGARLSGALLSHAGDQFDGEESEALLVDALKHADIYGGLTQALLHVPEHRSPAIEKALLDGCLKRDSTTAYSFAAMLLYLRGIIPDPNDDSERPFLLRLVTDDKAERKAAVAELKQRLDQKR
jgi:hypothetical protein